MTYWCVSPGRSSALILFATVIFCLHPRSVAAQALPAKPASTDYQEDQPLPTRRVGRDSLPDTPLPAGQGEQMQDPATPPALQQNQLLDLPPTLTRTRPTGEDKLQIYIHKPLARPP
jgi:hypothetical protein